MKHKTLVSTLLLVLALQDGLAAQTAPTTTPTTRARRALVVPPGFSAIKVKEHTIIVTADDAVWAKPAVEAVAPSTRPSTMPSDIRDRLKTMRDPLVGMIVRNLGLSDKTTIEKFIDEKLDPALEKIQSVKPPLFYLVTTDPKLKELIKGGWSDPRFYYNRIADTVEIRPASLSAGADSDDVLVPVLNAPADTVEQKKQKLTRYVTDTESDLAQLIAEQAMVGAQLGFVSFVMEQSINPLKLKKDQEWFGIGLVGVLSCRYGSLLTGVEAERLLRTMTSDNPGNPLKPAAVDLLQPTDPISMRNEAAVRAYADAYRRKSARVMLGWLNRAGDDAVPKILNELAKNPPADGPALVKTIQQVSGVDLSTDVKPGR